MRSSPGCRHTSLLVILSILSVLAGTTQTGSADNLPAGRLKAESAKLDGGAGCVQLFGGVKAEQQADAKPAAKRLKSETARAAPIIRTARTDMPVLRGSLFENRFWFTIPPWLAGVWRTQDKELLADDNYRTGKHEPPRELDFGYCGEHYGWQKDSQGGYWQYTEASNRPSNYRVDARGNAHFDVIISYRPQLTKEHEFVLVKNWRAVSVNGRTDIEKSRYCQSTITFDLLSSNQVMITEAVRSFNDNGSLLTFRETRTFKQRIAPFEALDVRKGQDVRIAFSDFMTSQAAPHTVPTITSVSATSILQQREQ